MAGWNLPPGVTTRMINEQFAEGPCECCGKDCDACICPECPTCQTHGDPKCYGPVEKGGHGLKLNKEQVIAQARRRIDILKDRINDEEMYIAWLEEQKDVSMDWSEVNRG